MWYNLKDIQKSPSGRISAVVDVPPDSRWFQGHFPGEPILPGVALIEMVYEITCRAQGAGRLMQGLRRVRFKQIIRPHDILDITISFMDGDEAKSSFQVLLAGEVVSSGHMIFQETS